MIHGPRVIPVGNSIKNVKKKQKKHNNECSHSVFIYPPEDSHVMNVSYKANGSPQDL